MCCPVKRSKSSLEELKRRYGGNIYLYQGEHPRHRVILAGFWMGRYEVTQAQYKAVMGKNPSYFKGDGRRPVEQVSWHNAVEFCTRFGAKHGVAVRLPTEAEWEYAARAGSTTAYYWGDGIDGNYLWYYENSGNTTHRVGEKLPNRLGLYDMAGNVWEWCQDRYGEYYYRISPEWDPKGPDRGQKQVLRGGSWDGCEYDNRSAIRCSDYPYGGDNGIGFRVVVVSSTGK